MRRIYVIALIVALVLAFWATGRADSALAPWGLNHGTCYQVLGSYYCGDQAKHIAELRGDQP